MIKKLLIANRGEIAVRIIRTCRRLGIISVAVYSEPDMRNRHVHEADEAYPLPGKTAKETYLAGRLVIEKAIKSGCDAIHPGYGFLAENPDFARMVTSAGLVFVGPPADVIALMGDKIAARRLAETAGVCVIPGTQEPVDDLGAAMAAAEKIGYPVMLKPAAGGGGKGMRVAREQSELESVFLPARAEAEKGFGDGRLFLEKYIEAPRHIEIQILADSHGNVVSLFERECSIQRRHQKVIEEAPSTALTPELRREMGEAACRLARAAGYVNAGTVEFILDSQNRFYFLEMNTRLQVEHPVTEMITGLDLVEEQLKIACNKPLSVARETISINGWAIEARICAEDPKKDFFPATGMVTRYAEPRGRNVRVDSGIEAGSVISVYYDSLLAKVIVWGSDREEARRRLIDALNGYHIEGVVCNLDFVNRILNLSAFAKAELSTSFIEENFRGGDACEPPPRDQLEDMVIAASIIYHAKRMLLRESVAHMVSTIGKPPEPVRKFDYVVRADPDVFTVTLRPRREDRTWIVEIDGRKMIVSTPPFEFYRRRLKLTINGKTVRFVLSTQGNFIAVSHCGINRVFEVYDPREWRLAKYMPASSAVKDESAVICPMPGMVVDVRVSPGERVYKGQEVVIIESMKMQSGVASPRDGIVDKVLVKCGDAVDPGDHLVTFRR